MFTALLGVGTTAFFAVPVWLVNHAPRAFVNVPTARYWGAARAPRPDARTRQADMWLLGGWTVLLLTAVQLLLVRAAGMAQPSRGRAGQPMERLDDLDRRPDSHGHSSHTAIVTPGAATAGHTSPASRSLPTQDRRGQRCCARGDRWSSPYTACLLYTSDAADE